MAEEKRKFERLNLLTDVNYTKKGPVEKESLSHAKNISTGGICIISYEPLEVSDVLDLKIQFPGDSAPINVVGRVAWVREFTIGDETKGKRFDAGIEFIEINNEDRNKINKYVFSRT